MGKFNKEKDHIKELDIDHFCISKIKQTWIWQFHWEDHIVYYSGHEKRRQNGVAFIDKTI